MLPQNQKLRRTIKSINKRLKNYEITSFKKFLTF